MLRPQITGEREPDRMRLFAKILWPLWRNTPPLETALGRDGTHAKRGRKKGLTNLLLQSGQER